MDLQALSAALVFSTGLLVLGFLNPQGQSTVRYDEALAATDAEPDALLRSRARVEILYRAGDLPSALEEALTGLQRAPSDRILLRRALELETDLRLADLAATHDRELQQAVKRDALDAEARRWWESEANALSNATRELQRNQALLASATTRARWISWMILGIVVAATIVLALSRAPAGMPRKAQNP